jgi:DNA-binding NarL/FixJ family response regulator
MSSTPELTSCPKRIILAEPRKEIISALQLLLEQEGEFAVVGKAQSGDRLLDLVKEKKPDILLIEWKMLKNRSADLLPHLRESAPALKIIVMSGKNGEEKLSLQHGADDYVSKTEPPDRLLMVIRRMCSYD